MAKRAGKYKLTKRDSGTSLIDGGQLLEGSSLDLKGGQTIIHQDFATVSGSSATDDAFTGEAGVLTEAAHAGKIVYLPDFPGNATLRIPTPSKACVQYKLIYGGVADDVHNLVVTFPDDECYFKCNECCGEHKTKIILRNDLAKNRKKIGKGKDLLEDDYGRIW